MLLCIFTLILNVLEVEWIKLGQKGKKKREISFVVFYWRLILQFSYHLLLLYQENVFHTNGGIGNWPLKSYFSSSNKYVTLKSVFVIIGHHSNKVINLECPNNDLISLQQFRVIYTFIFQLCIRRFFSGS